jgi:SET domain-containing protein
MIMDNTNQQSRKQQPKKVLHASLSEKIAPMLDSIKETFVVNEHKLEKVVKKAASFIADHLHISKGKPKKSNPRKKSAAAKKSPAVAKKAPAQKTKTQKTEGQQTVGKKKAMVKAAAKPTKKK